MSQNDKSLIHYIRDNTHGHFSHCSGFFWLLVGLEKYYGIRKIFVRIKFYSLNLYVISLVLTAAESSLTFVKSLTYEG